MEFIILREDTKEMALVEIKKCVEQNAAVFYTPETCAEIPLRLQYLENEVKLNISWLSTDTSYQTIKGIFTSQNAIFKRVDWFDPSSFQSIGPRPFSCVARSHSTSARLRLTSLKG